MEQIKVYARFKPDNSNPQTQANPFIILTDELIQSKYNDQVFQFNKVFGEECSNEDVYRVVGQNLVESACQGINCTLFTYGQTSSGKTFTMRGTQDMAGVIQLTVQDLFDHIYNSDNMNFTVSVSFLEIYNEMVNDLLCEDSKNLEIREINKSLYVQNLTTENVTNFQQVISLLNKGEKCKQIAETAMNKESSRSHTIFCITVESSQQISPYHTYRSQINLVDLAGSENIEIAQTKDMRAQEGKHINKSLFYLSKALQDLSEIQNGKKVVVSYRDSKITRYLKYSLQGNCKLGIICTLSAMNFQQTISTLKFGNQCRSIKFNPNQNIIPRADSKIEWYKQERAQLNAEIYQLQMQLQEKNDIISQFQGNQIGTQMQDLTECSIMQERDEFLQKIQSLQSDKKRLESMILKSNKQKLRMTPSNYCMSDKSSLNHSYCQQSGDFDPIGLNEKFEIQFLQKAIQEKDQDIDKLRQQIEQMEEYYDSKYQNSILINDQIAEKLNNNERQNYEELKIDIEYKEMQIQNLSFENQELKVLIDELRQKIQYGDINYEEACSLKDFNLKLSNQIQNLQKQLDELEIQRIEDLYQNEQLIQKVQLQEEQIKSLQDKALQKEKKLTDLNMRWSDLSIIYQQLQEEAEKLLAENLKLNNTQTFDQDLISELQRVRLENDRINQQNQQIKQQLQQIQAENEMNLKDQQVKYCQIQQLLQLEKVKRKTDQQQQQCFQPQKIVKLRIVHVSEICIHSTLGTTETQQLKDERFKLEGKLQNMKLNYKYLKKQNIELKEQMNNDNTPLIKMYKTTLKNQKKQLSMLEQQNEQYSQQVNDLNNQMKEQVQSYQLQIYQLENDKKQVECTLQQQDQKIKDLLVQASRKQQRIELAEEERLDLDSRKNLKSKYVTVCQEKDRVFKMYNAVLAQFNELRQEYEAELGKKEAQQYYTAQQELLTKQSGANISSWLNFDYRAPPEVRLQNKIDKELREQKMEDEQRRLAKRRYPR